MGYPEYRPPWHIEGPAEESYSRKLDRRVLNQEMPYGYDMGEPPAGHDNHMAKEQIFQIKRKAK